MHSYQASFPYHHHHQTIRRHRTKRIPTLVTNLNPYHYHHPNLNHLSFFSSIIFSPPIQFSLFAIKSDPIQPTSYQNLPYQVQL